MPMQETCPHCHHDTRGLVMRAFSMKFNAFFCTQNCYENYRKQLDGNWNDKILNVVNPKNLAEKQ